MNSSEKELGLWMHPETSSSEMLPVPRAESTRGENTVPGASQSWKPRTARRCSFKEMQLLPGKQHQSRVESGKTHTRVSPLLSSRLLPVPLVSWTQKSRRAKQPDWCSKASPRQQGAGRRRAERKCGGKSRTKVENPSLSGCRAEHVGPSLCVGKTL